MTSELRKARGYLKYHSEVRKLIYTTNAVEDYHRQIRKVTRIKGAFTSGMALLALISMATQNSHKRWIQPLQNRSITISQLIIIFGGLLK